MSHPSRRTGSMIPVVVVLVSTVVFGGMVFVFWSATKPARSVEELPRIANELPGPAGFDPYNIPECTSVLDAPDQTVPLLLAKIETTDDVKMRLLCFALICQMGRQEAVPMVIAHIESRDNERIAWAVWGCGETRLGGAVVNSLGELIRQSQDAAIAGDALNCLSQTGAESAVNVYQWVLENRKEQKVRREAIEKMSAIDSAATVYALEKLFTDADAEIARTAIDRMNSFSKAESAVREVMKRAVDSEEPRVRKAAIQLMDRLDDMDGLTRALSSIDEEIAVEAARLLSDRKKGNKLGEANPSAILNGMERLVARTDRVENLETLGRAMVSFVGLDERDRYFDEYTAATPGKRVAWIWALGAVVRAKGANAEGNEARMAEITNRFVADLADVRGYQKEAYRWTLQGITGHDIEADADAWGRFLQVEGLIDQAKDKMKDPAGGLITTFGRALRDEIYALLDESKGHLDWLRSSGKTRDVFKRQYDMIENLRNHVLHHGGLGD